MDVIFDIDGTLADAAHRLHYIKDMGSWASPPGKLPRPNWEKFLSDEEVIKDGTIVPVWTTMFALLREGHRVLFITGRPERQRAATEAWMRDKSCVLRSSATSLVQLRTWPQDILPIFMRKDGDRRPSHIVKEEVLFRARAEGFDPVMVFEDRADDAAMWRRNGLLCCQIAEGNY